MQRPIKFRAWDKKSKRMWQRECLLLIDIADGKVFHTVEDCYQVGRYILLQDTGLKDKNGKEVYEGDIITGDLFDRRLPTRGEVLYDQRHACFANKNLGGATPLSKINRIEIIGNIYEQPELLNS